FLSITHSAYTEIYTLSLHDALPIYALLDLAATVNVPLIKKGKFLAVMFSHFNKTHHFTEDEIALIEETADRTWAALERARAEKADRKSTRLNSSHVKISYAVFCLKK